MPKHIDPLALIREFGGSKVWSYNVAKKDLFCKVCSTSCPAGRRSTIAQHVQSKKHLKHLEQQQAGQVAGQATMHQVVAVGSSPS